MRLLNLSEVRPLMLMSPILKFVSERSVDSFSCFRSSLCFDQRRWSFPLRRRLFFSEEGLFCSVTSRSLLSLACPSGVENCVVCCARGISKILFKFFLAARDFLIELRRIFVNLSWIRTRPLEDWRRRLNVESRVSACSSQSWLCCRRGLGLRG